MKLSFKRNYRNDKTRTSLNIAPYGSVEKETKQSFKGFRTDLWSGNLYFLSFRHIDNFCTAKVINFAFVVHILIHLSSNHFRNN